MPRKYLVPIVKKLGSGTCALKFRAKGGVPIREIIVLDTLSEIRVFWSDLRSDEEQVLPKVAEKGPRY